MTENKTLNRRQALKATALSVLSLPLMGTASVPAAETSSFAKKTNRASTLKLDVASYSLAKLPRIGLCLDVAHGFRAGGNAAETIRQCSERLYEVHLKDTGP